MDGQNRDPNDEIGPQEPRRRGSFTWVELILTAMLICLAGLLALPKAKASAEARHRSSCQANLKELGLAFKYEVIPAGLDVPAATADPLRYQTATATNGAAHSGELFNLKLRYKTPSASQSQLLETPVFDADVAFQDASSDFRFATAVAAFGMLLRGGAPAQVLDYRTVHAWASDTVDSYSDPERREFLELVETASEIQS